MLTELSLLVLAETVTIMTADRIAPPATPSPQIETIAVRISSPQGVLWQGNLRVGANQGASYSQNLSQAAPDQCPSGSPYDRSERSSISFNLYVQNYGNATPSYRFDASWARPVLSADCGKSGTRTVQISQAVVLQPGQTTMTEGDAGLRVELTRGR